MREENPFICARGSLKPQYCCHTDMFIIVDLPDRLASQIWKLVNTAKRLRGQDVISSKSADVCAAVGSINVTMHILLVKISRPYDYDLRIAFRAFVYLIMDSAFKHPCERTIRRNPVGVPMMRHSYKLVRWSSCLQKIPRPQGISKFGELSMPCRPKWIHSCNQDFHRERAAWALDSANPVAEVRISLPQARCLRSTRSSGRIVDSALPPIPCAVSQWIP